MYTKSTISKAYINFLLYNIADSFSFNINSSLPDLDELLHTRWACPAVATKSVAPSGTPSAASFQKPNNHQSNPIKLFNTPPPHQAIPTPLHEVTQGPLWLHRP